MLTQNESITKLTQDIKLSILIPCYNWDMYNLINNLYDLCNKEVRLNDFEIISIEDGSTNFFSNISIKSLKNVQYEILSKNIGRSSIRNLLAKKAKFNWLLFMDCDSKIATQDFIWNYIEKIIISEENTKILNKIQPDLIDLQEKIQNNIYYGETIYEKIKTTHTLHQKYGLRIESKRKKKIFSSHHFLIHKSTFQKHKFDEKIISYGYEDVLFQMQNNSAPINISNKHILNSKEHLIFHFIKNPLYHIGLKTNMNFIKDTESGLKNLLKYIKNKDLVYKIKILKWWSIVSLFRLKKPIIFIFKIFKKSILKNLNSNNPNLLLFQFYKLGFFLSIEHNLSKKSK